MPRIRTIKPEFWSDVKIGKLSPNARLLFIACWNLADDEGIFIAEPEYLLAQVFPYDRYQKRLMEKWILELGSQKLVSFLQVNGQKYGYVLTFKRHQTINRPQKTRWPDVFEAIFKHNSVNTHGTFTEYSLTEGEGGGEGEKEIYKEKESIKKKDEKDDEKDDDKKIAEIFTAYENNIGLLTPMIKDELDLLIKDFPADWIVDAFRECNRSQARNLRYAEKILENRRNGGKAESNRTYRGNPSQKPAGAFDDIEN